MSDKATCLPRRQALALVAGAALAATAGSRVVAAPEPISIFFDFERARLSPGAKQLLQAVMGYIKPNAAVSLVGHCDTAEKNADKLSLARAVEVLSAMSALGVPRGVTFTVAGKGATALRVKTGPNVHEPRNRYVALTIG